MTGAGADWPAIAGDVAVALLGEPSSRSGRELRYGRKGSLSVHLDKGTWRDHESATGGGVLDLVKRERGCDTAGAMAWLESAGFVESRDPVRCTESASKSFSRSRTYERATTTPESRHGAPERERAGDATPDPAAIPARTRERRLWRSYGRGRCRRTRLRGGCTWRSGSRGPPAASVPSFPQRCDGSTRGRRRGRCRARSGTDSRTARTARWCSHGGAQAKRTRTRGR